MNTNYISVGGVMLDAADIPCTLSSHSALAAFMDYSGGRIYVAFEESDDRDYVDEFEIECNVGGAIIFRDEAREYDVVSSSWDGPVPNWTSIDISQYPPGACVLISKYEHSGVRYYPASEGAVDHWDTTSNIGIWVPHSYDVKRIKALMPLYKRMFHNYDSRMSLHEFSLKVSGEVVAVTRSDSMFAAAEKMLTKLKQLREKYKKFDKAYNYETEVWRKLCTMLAAKDCNWISDNEIQKLSVAVYELNGEFVETDIIGTTGSWYTDEGAAFALAEYLTPFGASYAPSSEPDPWYRELDTEQLFAIVKQQAVELVTRKE